MNYRAHSRNDNGSGVSELLRDHLQRVAERTAGFAASFAAEHQGRMAGLLHDLGKYGDQFQQRLQDPQHVRGRDHWTAGALAAAEAMKRKGIIPATVIAGHHVGLGTLKCKWSELRDAMAREMQLHPELFSDTDLRRLYDRFVADGLALPHGTDGLAPTATHAADMLDVRMLFSALVDADFLETEAHFAGDAQCPYRPRRNGPTLDIDKSIAAMDRFMDAIRNKHRNSPMTVTREKLLQDCLAAASKPQGLFTLSAPTGAGKTLAMLAFALHHARTHRLRRIVVVMPFLNIIDQTAEIYREIFCEQEGFDPCTVLEHHSLDDHCNMPSNGGNIEQDIERDDGLSPRLLAENWDAPVILTTNVQFLESLMADRPSRCRKLHRLAKSVILCDEVQSLPPSLAVATLATLSHLADPAGPYHSTIVFSTATHPAFDAFNQRISPEFASHGWLPTEIVSDIQSLYASSANRVHVQWRHDSPISLDDVAAELKRHRQVLCIVNLKRHTANLIASLRDGGMEEHCGLMHLSTNMCPAHREKVLQKVRSRLEHGQPVCLIATQCVEAGVDLDFPVVYRALAPLDAIAQAAGRCNRHGNSAEGQVIVFKPHDDRRLYPPGYDEAVDATESFLKFLSTRTSLDAAEILGDPEQLRSYYRRFYRLTGKDSSESDQERTLLDAIRGGDFGETAKCYKLIKNESIRVLTPYQSEVFEHLRDEIEQSERFSLESIRDWIRRASPHAVNLFRPKETDAIAAYLQPIQFSHRRTVEAREANWFYTLPDVAYDPLLGISTEVERLWIV